MRVPDNLYVTHFARRADLAQALRLPPRFSQPPPRSGRWTSVVRTYKDLVVWQRAYALLLAIYRATSAFPAEGHHRSTLPDYHHFLVQARGSVAELETGLILARDLGYLRDEFLVTELGHVERLLSGLMRSIARLRRGE